MTILSTGSVGIGTATDGMTAAGSLAIAQDLAHRGTLAGFFNIAPAVRPSAFTQTYNTSSHTHAAITAVDPGAYTTGAYGYVSDAMAAAVHAEVIALRADITNIKNVITALIDDGQSLGLLQ
jgi:hypothetical protein